MSITGLVFTILGCWLLVSVAVVALISYGIRRSKRGPGSQDWARARLLWRQAIITRDDGPEHGDTLDG